MEITNILENAYNIPDAITGQAFSDYLVNTFLNVLFSVGLLVVTFMIFQTYERTKMYDTMSSKFKYNKEVCFIIFGALVSLFSL